MMATLSIFRCDVVGCQEQVTTDDEFIPDGWATLAVFPLGIRGRRAVRTAYLCPHHVPTVVPVAPDPQAA